MAFLDKVKEYFDKGIEVSKDALSKAGDAVQDFGDKSVVRIEIKQLESKLNKEYSSLGTQVYNLYSANKDEPLRFDDAHISGVLDEIQRLLNEIDARRNALQDDNSGEDSTSTEESNAEDVSVGEEVVD